MLFGGQSIRQSVVSGRAFVVLASPALHGQQQVTASGAAVVLAQVVRALCQQVRLGGFRCGPTPKGATRHRQCRQYDKQASR